MSVKAECHPAERLLQGECHTVLDALQTCEQQYWYQMAIGGSTDELTTALEAVRDLLVEYHQRMSEAESDLLRQWSERDDSFVADIGDALRERRFEDLAI